MRKRGQDIARAYGLALAFVAAALLARLAMQPLVSDHVPFLPFFLAVVAAGAWLGRGPGIAAAGASAIATVYFIFPPHYSFLPLSREDGFALLGFLVVAAAVLFAIDRAVQSQAREVESQRARMASELREQRLIDAAQDYAIYELDRQGRILTWNKGAERLKGWKAEEIIGKPYQVLHTAESRAKNAPGRELAIAAETGRFEEEAPRQRKDGSIFAAHVSLFPLRDESGEVTGYVKVTRDISEGSKAGKAILETRRRMEAIVQSAMDAIITIDEELRIVLFNPAAERMFGYESGEILGQTVTILFPEELRDRHADYLRRFFESTAPNDRTTDEDLMVALRRSSEKFPIEASISQVTVGGERVGTLILRDITERKTGEEARALLAREVDHRAKNALAVAQALVGLTKGDTVEQFAEAIRGRIASLARAHTLLSQSQWRGAPLDQLIRDELQPYAKDSQLTVAGPPVNCQAAAVQSLSLLFHELATNAVKHGALGNDGGHVSVSWKLEGDWFQVSWEERGGPPVQSPTREGFGTRLLRQVAGRQLDAELDFQWERNGLRVEIRLPANHFTLTRSASAASDDDPSAQPAEAGGRERRILIVEDEELVALELSGELSRLGWAIVGPAATLTEAQALLSRPVDAAVLDVNLRGRPVYPLAQTLADRDVPFIFCTGYELVDPDGRFADVPVIRKPVQPTVVSAALSELLSARAS